MNTLDKIDNGDVYEEARADTQIATKSMSQILAELKGMNAISVNQENQLHGSQNTGEGEAAMPPAGVEDLPGVANELSKATQMEDAERKKKIGVMSTIEWASSPLLAIGDAALAPIARMDEIGDGPFRDQLGNALSISGEAFMARAFPKLGEEHEDYGKSIVDQHMDGLPEIMKPVVATTLNMVSDPTVSLGLGAAKIFQAGVKAKKLQSAGQEVNTNRGIWEEGVHKILGFDERFDPNKLSEVGQVAAKADRGDQVAIDKLNQILSDTHITDVANMADVAASKAVVDDYARIMGDSTAAVWEKTKLTKAAISEGIISNDGLGQAFNINLSKLNTPQDVDVFLSEVSKHFESVFKRTKGTQTIKQMTDEAQMAKLEDLIGRKTTNFSGSQAFALRQSLATTGTLTQKLLAKAERTGAPMDALAAQKAFFINLQIQRKVTGVASEMGRGLRQFREVAGTTRSMYRQVKGLMDNIDIDDEFMRIMRKANVENLSPKEFQRLADKGHRGWLRKGYDGFYEAYANSILSGPLTHATNIVSNAAMITLRVGEKYLESLSAAGRLNLVKASDDLKEANAMVSGLTGAMSDIGRLALRRANKADLRYPEELEQMHELARQRVRPQIDSANLGVTGALGKAVDFVGSIIRMPGNALLKEDKAFKLLNYRMTVNQEAVAKAMATGRNADDVKAIFRAIKNNPDEAISGRAIDAANLYTFTNKLEGKLGKMEEVLRAPGLNLVVPFFRTPLNIARFGVRNSFIGNITKELPHLMAKSAKGDVARAKFAMGTLAPASLLMMMGDNVTGHRDMTSNKGRLKAEFQGPEYSIKVGDKWYSYAKLEPVRSMIGMMANYRDAINALDATDPEESELIDQITSVTVTPFLQTVADNTFLEVFGHLHYLFDGAMSGDITVFGNQMEKMAAAMMAPNFISQMTSLEFDGKYRMADTVIDQWKKRVWGLSDEMPIRPNAFGDPQYVPRGVMFALVNPFLASPERNDPIANEMVALGANIPDITPKEITVNSIKLELDVHQRSRLGQLIGRGMKESLENDIEYIPPMRDVIKRMIKDPLYVNMPEELNEFKRKKIEMLYMQRKKIMTQFLVESDPSLKAVYQQKSAAREQKMSLMN